VIIDCRYVNYIDNDVKEVIWDFKNATAPQKGILLNILGQEALGEQGDHIQFVDVLNKEAQQRMEPAQIVEMLKRGNQRFIDGVATEKYLKQQMNATSFGQNPIAVILSCIDSRTTTEHIFDLGLGDIFSVRIAGNVLNDDILGSIEFATVNVGAKVVLVLGHTRCGAVVGACNHAGTGYLKGLLDKITPVLEKEKEITEDRTGSNMTFVNRVAVHNVLNSMNEIRNKSESVARLEKEGKIILTGALYEVETGIVHFFDSTQEGLSVVK
jgi:carbonic anhydrase